MSEIQVQRTFESQWFQFINVFFQGEHAYCICLFYTYIYYELKALEVVCNMHFSLSVNKQTICL